MARGLPTTCVQILNILLRIRDTILDCSLTLWHFSSFRFTLVTFGHGCAVLCATSLISFLHLLLAAPSSFLWFFFPKSFPFRLLLKFLFLRFRFSLSLLQDSTSSFRFSCVSFFWVGVFLFSINFHCSILRSYRPCHSFLIFCQDLFCPSRI